MQELFITNIRIDKIRHLKNIDIPLSRDTKKHLILTGKNGSGKTSLLEVLKSKIADTKGIRVGVALQKIIDSVSEDSEENKVTFNRGDYRPSHWRETENVFVYCSAERALRLDLPKAIEAVDISRPIKLDELASKSFVQYMLYLNYQKMSAIANQDEMEQKKIEQWFDRFTGALRKIYDCPELRLVHNSRDLSFKIHMPKREPFGLNEMADGYSSLLYIVMELMIRMEHKADISYDLPGIALIDEVETHLHVELQKRVLVFLTEMFPRIQFIVTTHSPFVITSLKNAVVFDLEKQEALEDLSAYSYEGIIESYFGTDMYSQKATQMFEQYKSLVDKPNRTPEESRRFTDAVDYLNQIPLHSAKELVYAFRELEQTGGRA